MLEIIKEKFEQNLPVEMLLEGVKYQFLNMELFKNNMEILALANESKIIKSEKFKIDNKPCDIYNIRNITIDASDETLEELINFFNMKIII